MKYFRVFSSVLLMVFIFNCNENTNSIRLSPQSFQDSISKPNTQIIDVRTAKEFSAGYIEGAINIDYFSKTFADSIRILNPNKPVFIYCRSGKRSAKSVSVFEKEGFNIIYELKGGFLNWEVDDF